MINAFDSYLLTCWDLYNPRFISSHFASDKGFPRGESDCGESDVFNPGEEIPYINVLQMIG